MSPATSPEFSAVHSDIIRTHVLTRLDGTALSALTCTSAQLSALATDEDLWRDVTTATWPSTSDPRIRDSVSSFPSGHRSFFSDAFPVLHHRDAQKNTNSSAATSSVELISAVDLYYKNDVIFSKVLVSETESGWFQCSPFRLDLLDQKESVPTGIWNPTDWGLNGDDWLNHLEENLSLSWIVIDPARNKAANLSTRDPISVQRHWLTGDVQVKYSTIVGGGRRGSAAEMVQVSTVVTLSGGKKGGDEVQVTEVSMQMEDMEGKTLGGLESLGILLAAIDGGKRKKWERGQGKARFEEYEERRRERKVEQQKREKALDFACIVTIVTIFMIFWTYILIR